MSWLRFTIVHTLLDLGWETAALVESMVGDTDPRVRRLLASRGTRLGASRRARKPVLTV
jgi:hypothetical protein